MAASGLALEGMCCFIIPFCSSYGALMIPLCGICFGIALIDTALLPTLGYLVDVRYVSVYGSIYAIADISYSVAYAVGPIIAGGVVEAIGFTALNIGIAFSNLLYAPVLMYLRHIYDFKPFQDEADVLMQNPPDKEYQTYVLQEQRPLSGEVGNHLNQARMETNVDQGYQEQNYQAGQNYDYGQNINAAGYAQPGYEQQPPVYEQQPTANYQQPVAYTQQRMTYAQQEQAGSHQVDVNPFRRPGNVDQKPSGDSNPFRQGMY